MIHLIGYGLMYFGVNFFAYGSLRFFVLSHTHCPWMNGLKEVLTRFFMRSAASFPAAMALFLWWSRVQSLSSDDSTVGVSIILGIPGGVNSMIRSNDVLCWSK